MQDEQHARLRRLRDGGKRFAVARDGDERRRRGVVVVPQIVVHGLEMPHDPSGRRAQRHDRVRIAVVAEPECAVIVRRGARCRHENQIARRIRRHDRPHVCGAGLRGASVPPRRERGILGILRYRMPCPSQRACARVECAHLAARRCRPRVVGNRRTRNHQIVDDDRWGGHLIRRWKRRRNAKTLAETDGALDTEDHTWVARPGIERDQPRIDGRHVDAAAARRARLQRAVDPCRHAAVREIAVAAFRIDARVIPPDFASGCRLERHHLSERRADVHHVVRDDRRHLKGRLSGQIEGRLAGVIRPRHDEPRNVVARDACERRKSSTSGIAAVDRPVARGLSVADRCSERQRKCEGKPGARFHRGAL